MYRKRIKPDAAHQACMNGSQTIASHGQGGVRAEGVGGKTLPGRETKAKGGYIKAKSEQLRPG